MVLFGVLVGASSCATGGGSYGGDEREDSGPGEFDAGGETEDAAVEDSAVEFDAALAPEDVDAGEPQDSGSVGLPDAASLDAATADGAVANIDSGNVGTNPGSDAGGVGATGDAGDSGSGATAIGGLGESSDASTDGADDASDANVTGSSAHSAGGGK